MMNISAETASGSTIVLLHGFPLDRSMWVHQVEGFRGSYRVIAPDLPGHGGSPLFDDPLTVDGMADDIIDMLNQLGIMEPVVLGGLSMGGYVALSLAVRYHERFCGLMLINTRAGADAPETARVREDLAQLVESAGSPEVVVRTMLPKLFAPATYETKPELVESLKKVMDANAPASVAATCRALATRANRIPDLPNITIPTLVVAGATDQLIPTSESEAMAAAIPNAELVIIPDSGHMSPLENPEATNAAISAFLGRIG